VRPGSCLGCRSSLGFGAVKGSVVQTAPSAHRLRIADGCALALRVRPLTLRSPAPPLRASGVRGFILYHTHLWVSVMLMSIKFKRPKGKCTICGRPVALNNPNSRKQIHTHPGTCRRLYHNYRMAKIRGNVPLALRHQRIWQLTRRRKGATKKELVSRSANPANKGRHKPVKTPQAKLAGGSFL